MQENPRSLSLQCDLLALSAVLEAASGGDNSLECALQASRLQSLSRDLHDRGKRAPAAVDADDPLRQLEQRLAKNVLLQRDLGALAGEIETCARRDTGALQFEDVESRVVVYSKHRTRELRTQLQRIEELRQTLQAGIETDRKKLAATADAIKHRLSEQRTQSKKKPRPDR